MSSVPYTFANSVGNIPLAYLDANFSNVKAATDTAGTVTTAAQPNITSVGTLSSLSVTGNVTAANFIGNISGNIANAVYSDTAGTVTTAAQPNITSVGTLSVLTASGNIRTTGGAFVGSAAGLTSIPGANVTGVVANATYATTAGSATTATSSTTAGTVTTAAQPNITSVGTLSSLTVTGNITGGNVISTHYGSGAGLSSLTGANVTGTVANATYATIAGSATTATSSTTAGTVTTAAQPNISSVGTLSSLTVTGNILFGSGGTGVLTTDSLSTIVTSTDTNRGVALASGDSNTLSVTNSVAGVIMITGYNSANRALAWNNGTLDFDAFGVSSPGNIANVRSITVSNRVITTPVPLANLTAIAGGRAFINNANLVATGNFGAQVAGGGSNTVPVWSDGTNWYIG